MKAMTKKQQFCMIMMIVFMILTDILICFDNNVLQILGYLSLAVVTLFAIYFWIIGRGAKQEKQLQDIQKMIKETTKNKED